MPAELGPLSLPSARDGAVAALIRRASAKTGAQFDYLMKTAMRESSLNPDARAKTSSAAGLFQFIEQTWLGVVKKYGARHGLGAEAAAIRADADGRYAVASPALREQILDLRFDARVASALAGELANENAGLLENRLGRAATSADLYAAHFLGPHGAVKLLRAAADARAADILPAAAKANAHVFYDGGCARTVAEVISSIAASMGVEPPASAPAREIEVAAGPIETKAFSEPRAERPSWANAQTPLSFAAVSILQALDPSRLIARSREDDER